MDLIKLGQTLHKKRDELRLSLRDAGELIGISHNYLSILEKAKDPRSDAPIKPTIDTLKLISDAYHVDVNTLLPLAGYEDIIIQSNKQDNLPLVKKENLKPKEQYPEVHDVEEAMKIILDQPGLMLKGELLSDESKIILANAIQMGLRTAEELEKKRNKGDSDE